VINLETETTKVERTRERREEMINYLEKIDQEKIDQGKIDQEKIDQEKIDQEKIDHLDGGAGDLPNQMIDLEGIMINLEAEMMIKVEKIVVQEEEEMIKKMIKQTKENRFHHGQLGELKKKREVRVKIKSGM